MSSISHTSELLDGSARIHQESAGLQSQQSVKQPMDVGRFDCAVSIEVAEHLPAEKNGVFIANIARAEPKVIVFTAAPPRQMGRGHINCCPMREWIGDFGKAGFAADPAEADRVKKETFTRISGVDHYMRNLMVFTRLPEARNGLNATEKGQTS